MTSEEVDDRIGLVLEPPVAEIHLNRPNRLNALTVQMLKSLSDLIRSLAAREDVKAVILTGSGRAFSAGDDLKEAQELTTESFAALIDAFQDVTRALMTSPVPSLAAINGIAVGGAAEITIACDLRIGCPETELFFPENGIGLTISNGSTLLLPSLVGRRAIGLVLMERRIRVDEASQLGLLDHVVTDGNDLLPEAREIARRLAEATATTSYHVRLLRPPLSEIEGALEAERQAAVRAWESGVVARGMDRFWSERDAGH